MVSKRTISDRTSERSIMKGARQLLVLAGMGTVLGTRGGCWLRKAALELFTVSQFLAIQRHPSISLDVVQ